MKGEKLTVLPLTHTTWRAWRHTHPETPVLSTVGMPRAEIPLALLMFNIGVELWQLVFVVLILLLHRALTVLEFRWPRWAELGPAYLIGTLGAYWAIQRTAMML